MTTPANFKPALRVLRCDDRGRVNIGAIDSGAKGQSYTASIDSEGRVLLTPQSMSPASASGSFLTTTRAVE